MKILRNLCLNFERQDWQDGKNRKENHATKVTKIPKFRMNETYVTIVNSVSAQYDKLIK